MTQMMVQNSAIPQAIAQALAASGGMEHSALSEGVGVSFANVSFKGKVFRIKFGGVETLLVDPTTKQPLQYIDVVMVDAKPELSKTFYASGYSEGSSEAPDCSSEDGIHPTAPAGKQVQNADCRTCPWNAFGSKRSNDGIATNSKACADTRKVVIVPEFNLANENFGGPMLLRVPAASLTGLAEYDRGLRGQGAPFFAVVTRVSFDYTVAYPKLTFQTVRYISDAEAQQVLAMRNDPSGKVKDILSGGAGGLAQLPAPAPIAGQMPQQMQPQQAPVQQASVQQAPMQQAPMQQQQHAQPQQQQPQQPTASFAQPPAPPQAPQGQQPAPPMPQTAPQQAAPVPQQTQFGPPPVQMMQPPPIQPQGQTVVQGNFGGQPPQQQYGQPPQQQQQQYGQPPQQQYGQPQQPAPQAQQFNAPPVQQQQQQQFVQPAPAQHTPLPESVLNQVDALLGV